MTLFVALGALGFAHVSGFMAYLMFVPEMTAKWKLIMAFGWEFFAFYDFAYAFIEGLTYEH